MLRQPKIALSWVLISIGILIHSSISLMEHVYFSTKEHTVTKDGVPTEMQVIFIISMILPLIMGFATMYIENKKFIWFSIIYAGLLSFLNIFHFIEDGLTQLENIPQVITLLFIPVINIILVFQLIKWKKEVFN